MGSIQLQQLPSLLNQPPLPPPSFPPRTQPLGATRLSIGSSAQQQPPPMSAPAVEPYNSSFGVSFAAPSAGAPSAATALQPPAGAAHEATTPCRGPSAYRLRVCRHSLLTPSKSAGVETT